MSLKYYEAANAIRQINPKNSYKADYAAMLDLGFDNAPNVAYGEVEYESTYGENDFVVLDRVRIDTVVDYNTGIILGDDYKTFIFAPEFPIEPFYGMKFRWKNNYWLVINTNSYDSLPMSAEVRRCNNVLRFFNSKGEKVYEPCILDYTLRFANNQDTMTITVGNGEQKVWCQRNSNTTIIKPNDRFLFGTPEQRVSFRVYGGGTKNYLNGVTMDDNSPTLSEFYLEHYEVNPLFDDFENGFANAYLNEVSIIINDLPSQLKVGDKYILNASVYKGVTEIFDQSITWSSSNNAVASISNGTITGVGAGSCKITATLNNADITSSVSINVTSGTVEDRYELILSPNIDYVLQNKSQKFDVYLYKNGVKQNNPISFSDLSVNIPTGKYTITVNDDNSFTLSNTGMFMTYPVIVRCTSDSKTQDFNFALRGLY